MRPRNPLQQTQFEEEKRVLILYDHPDAKPLAERLAAHVNYRIPYGPRRFYWEFAWDAFDYVYLIYRKGDHFNRHNLLRLKDDAQAQQKGQRRKKDLARVHTFEYEEYSSWKQKLQNLSTGTPRGWEIQTVKQWTGQ